MGLELGAEHLLGVGAGERPGHIDPLFDGPVFYSVTDGNDYAGSVDTGCRGQFQARTVEPGADIGVNRIDTGRLTRHHYLARAGPGTGSGTSSSFITSGGPKEWTWIAFMIFFSVYDMVFYTR